MIGGWEGHSPRRDAEPGGGEGAGEEGTIYREEFSASGSTMNIEVTEYGDIGEHIKGTFSGIVKNGRTSHSVNITKGKFDVIRRDDQYFQLSHKFFLIFYFLKF